MESLIFECGEGYAFHFHEIFTGSLKQSPIYLTREECEEEERKFKGWNVMQMNKDELILKIKLLVARIAILEAEIEKLRAQLPQEPDLIERKAGELFDFILHPHVGHLRFPALPLPRKWFEANEMEREYFSESKI